MSSFIHKKIGRKILPNPVALTQHRSGKFWLLVRTPSHPWFPIVFIPHFPSVPPIIVEDMDCFYPYGVPVLWLPSLEIRSLYTSLKAKYTVLPDSANKVLLENSHAFSFPYYPWLLQAELGNCDRDCAAHKSYNIHSLALYRISLLTPVYMMPVNSSPPSRMDKYF